MQRRTQSLAEKFWPKVAIAGPDDCWLWQGALHTKMGYGNMRATPERQGNVSAHVISWFLHTGQWPPDGIFTLHHCDTTACVNPAHLWLGTQLDNVQDCIRKGRQGYLAHPECVLRGDQHPARLHPERMPRGDKNGARTHPERLPRGAKNHQTKLTDSQRKEIPQLYATGEWTLKQLGERYGVSAPAIRHWVTME